uniref:Uncharacterized protein n=1 Tax=candidate division WOR-3 bacterium TaxID=2052148 RepID=A0A7C2K5R0_UNCW3
MRYFWVLVLIIFASDFAYGGGGDTIPSPPSRAKKAEVKAEKKKFKDENKDGFNDLRDKGSYEKFLKEALKERKGKK